MLAVGENNTSTPPPLAVWATLIVSHFYSAVGDVVFFCSLLMRAMAPGRVLPETQTPASHSVMACTPDSGHILACSAWGKNVEDTPEAGV